MAATANSLWLIFQIGKWKIWKHTRRNNTDSQKKNHLKKVYASLGMWNTYWFVYTFFSPFSKFTFSSKFLRGIWAERISKCTKGGAKFIFGNAFWHCAWRQSRENSSTANMLRNMWKATKATYYSVYCSSAFKSINSIIEKWKVWLMYYKLSRCL